MNDPARRGDTARAALDRAPTGDPDFDFDRFVPGLIARAHFRMSLVAEELARRRGHPRPMLRLLLVLRDRGQHRVSDVAKRAGMRISVVSRLLYAMERRGLVLRDRPQGGDARAVTVALTESGQAMAALNVADCRRVEAALLAGFGTEDWRALIRLLRRLMDNIPLLEAEFGVKARPGGKH
jgi:DNA-binding MarR family transcriptional regulator